MKEVKYRLGKTRVYEVSLKNFKELTQEKYPYMQIDSSGKVAYAICPLCENPAKLLGVYAKLEKQEPHARHIKKNITGIADFDEYTYLKCPNHRKHADYVTEVRKRKDATPLNFEILELARDNFDCCIYLIRKATGLVISQKLAREMAIEYMQHPGYMTIDATRENIPWIMALCMTGKGLIGRCVEEDSPLYHMLKDSKQIRLERAKTKGKTPLWTIKSNVGYLDLQFIISRYNFSVDKESKLHEYLTLHIGVPDGDGTYRTFKKKRVEVDPFAFNRLLYAKKTYRNEVMLEIANEIIR